MQNPQVHAFLRTVDVVQNSRSHSNAMNQIFFSKLQAEEEGWAAICATGKESIGEVKGDQYMVYREWVFITDDIKLLAKYILCGENLFKNQFYRAKRAANYNKDENKQY